MAIAELNTLKPGHYYYSDIPANFSKSVVNNDISASYDLKAIQESIVGIVGTKKGDRPFNPEFGCDISNQLFENISAASAFAIKYSIENAISKWEPRVIIKKIEVLPLYEQNTYEVVVQYHLRTNFDRLFALKTSLNNRL
ncbi:baseplate wedge subunit [Vibrio phage nt-1]|uniref:Baseplate wedge subunit n=1 Tax=Vibrio phage nt-1 TaxID=115992 RepID=R9TG05_9CAUD|nr:baseplate wedge subunit [Vibrio phage nt-1]AGN30013.1 baseplate wedge subunit [Vibrio phage nt-1]